MRMPIVPHRLAAAIIPTTMMTYWAAVTSRHVNGDDASLRVTDTCLPHVVTSPAALPCLHSLLPWCCLDISHLSSTIHTSVWTPGLTCSNCGKLRQWKKNKKPVTGSWEPYSWHCTAGNRCILRLHALLSTTLLYTPPFNKCFQLTLTLVTKSQLCVTN